MVPSVTAQAEETDFPEWLPNHVAEVGHQGRSFHQEETLPTQLRSHRSSQTQSCATRAGIRRPPLPNQEAVTQLPSPGARPLSSAGAEPTPHTLSSSHIAEFRSQASHNCNLISGTQSTSRSEPQDSLGSVVFKKSRYSGAHFQSRQV